MERFLDFGIPDRDADQIAAYKADQEWKRVYDFLRRDYWHVTNPAAWDAIRQSGAIKPNLEGRFPTSWDDVVTGQSYAYLHGRVALFDFCTPSEDDAIRQWAHAWDVFMGGGGRALVRVLLQLTRERLVSKIIPNRRGHLDGELFGCIEHCEVWYPEDIPTDAISAAYRLPVATVFGQFNPEPIRLNERVEPEQRKEPAPPSCEGWTPDQAVQYVLDNPEGQLPRALLDLLPPGIFGEENPPADDDL
jgi:hypothetical protein